MKIVHEVQSKYNSKYSEIQTYKST